MADYIDRDKAIKEVLEWATELNHPTMLVKEDAIGILKMMPSADVRENVRGEWIRGDAEKLQGAARCSACGGTCYKGRHYFNFCPNCGADMRGESDE